MDHQDWKPVVWAKKPDKKKNVKKGSVAVANTNKNFQGQGTGKKIKDDDEIKRIPTVGMAIGKQIAQARNAKKMTQKQLAQAINCQVSVITELENGKAKYNPAVINKVKRALGISIKNKKKK